MKNKTKILTGLSFMLFMSIGMSSCHSSQGNGCGYWGNEETKAPVHTIKTIERNVYKKTAKTS